MSQEKHAGEEAIELALRKPFEFYLANHSKDFFFFLINYRKAKPAYRVCVQKQRQLNIFTRRCRVLQADLIAVVLAQLLIAIFSGTDFFHGSSNMSGHILARRQLHLWCGIYVPIFNLFIQNHVHLNTPLDQHHLSKIKASQ